jgi:hypothetical protein
MITATHSRNYFLITVAGPRDGPAAQLSGAPTKDVTGIMADKVSVNLGFHTRKNFSENYPQFWHTPSKTLASPILGQKSLKNIGSKGRHIISLPGALMSGALPDYYMCDLTQDDGSYIADKNTEEKN